MGTKRKKWKIISSIILAFILFVLLLLLRSSVWFLRNFIEMDFSTVIYQLFSPLNGTGRDLIIGYCKFCLCPAVVLTVIFYIVVNLYDSILERLILSFNIRVGKKKILLESNKKFGILSKILSLGMLFLILCVILRKQAILVGLPEFIESISNASELYEQEYVEPQDVILTFPQKKRNLLLIYMESMETTYASMSAGGAKPYNYIPGLTQLAEENISFSDDNDLGGADTCSNTTWTMAGLLASSSGINYKLPIDGNTAGEYEEFLKGLTTMGDILENVGYQNYFMCGSDAGFAGRRDFYEQHGNYHIWDYYSAMEDGIIPEGYYVFWGMEDKYLYEYAKQKITEIVANENAFNFTMLTVDTHHSNGYRCELCEEQYPEEYANVISCADRQICDFLEWAKEQEWYENTTIVITGDHCSMKVDFWDDIGDYERRVYNCFVNVPDIFSEIRMKNRTFSTMDMFPTVLAAMGVKIEGERLGLGTNLFSEESTLPEKMGLESFNEELRLHSDYYFNHFIIGGE